LCLFFFFFFLPNPPPPFFFWVFFSPTQVFGWKPLFGGSFEGRGGGGLPVVGAGGCPKQTKRFILFCGKFFFPTFFWVGKKHPFFVFVVFFFPHKFFPKNPNHPQRNCFVFLVFLVTTRTFWVPLWGGFPSPTKLFLLAGKNPQNNKTKKKPDPLFVQKLVCPTKNKHFFFFFWFFLFFLGLFAPLCPPLFYSFLFGSGFFFFFFVEQKPLWCFAPPPPHPHPHFFFVFFVFFFFPWFGRVLATNPHNPHFFVWFL